MIPPWSYSLLSDFANCPRKAYHKFIVKDLPREEKSEAQQWGIDIHRALEDRINSGTRSKLAEPYEHFVLPFETAAKAELKLGMSETSGPAPFFPKPWGRGVVDVFIDHGPSVVLLDWKTGKLREDPKELFCHAMLVKANFPKVEKITGAFVWLKDNKLGTVYDLSNTSRAEAGTRAAMKTMQTYHDSDYWPTTPNPLCGWCPVKTCEHNRS